MAEISKFFNAQEISPGVYDREYLASDFAEYFRSVLSAGLLLDENEEYGLQVNHGSGLDVSITNGRALIKGYYYANTTSLTLSHNIPETSHDRIDRIVLRMDLRNQSRYIKAFVKEGIANDDPVPPELQRDEYIYELSLAQVILRANTASVDPNDITDERSLEDVCGIVQSLITVPTSVFQQQFDAWFKNQKLVYGNEMEDWKDEQQQDFLDWFESIRDILDGDVAANLAARITALEQVVDDHLIDYEQFKNSSEIILDDFTVSKTLSIVKSNKNDEGIFTTVTYKRKSDDTNYAKAVLSGGTSPEYTTRTITFYDLDGTTVLDEKIYSLSYDDDGDLVGEE